MRGRHHSLTQQQNPNDFAELAGDSATEILNNYIPNNYIPNDSAELACDNAGASAYSRQQGHPQRFRRTELNISRVEKMFPERGS